MNLGQRIKAERKKRGLTQQALAGNHISRSLLSRIESGRCQPSAASLAVIARALGLTDEALLGGGKAQEDRRLVGRLLSLSNFSRSLPGKKRAEILTEALRIAQSLGDPVLLARVIEATGDAHYDQLRYSSALEDYAKALSALEGCRRHNRSGVARLELKLGHCCYDLAQFVNALSHYERASIAGASNPIFMTKVTRNLGNTCHRLGAFAAAAKHYRESQRLAQLQSDAASVAHATLGLGTALRRLGDTKAALETARKAEALYKARNDDGGVANARHNMGVAALDMGRLGEGKAWLDDALAFYTTRGLHQLAAAIHEELARYWVLAGDLESAESECRLGLALVGDGTPSVMPFRLQAMLAVVEREMGKPEGNERLQKAAVGLLDVGLGYELLSTIGYLLLGTESLKRKEGAP